MRLAVLQNIVAPTRHALFRALAEQPGIDPTVLFMAHNEPTRGWREEAGIDYPHVFLPGVHLPLRRRGDVDSLHLNPTIGRTLQSGLFDAVLCGGWLSPTTWLAQRTARRTGMRFLLWFGSTSPGGPAASLKRRFVRRSDAFVAYGVRAREQLVELGARRDRVTIAVNTTDVAPFAAARAHRAEARTRLALGPGPVALLCGRLVARKRVPRALALLARVAERVPGVQVLVAGDGPDRAGVMAAGAAHALSVRFLGDRAYADLPDVYAASDVLVTLAGWEPWGLVVNEALAAGVPVLATPAVTAAVELVPAGAGLVSDVEQELIDEAVRLLGSPEALAAARLRAESALPALLPARWAADVAAAARNPLS